MPDPVEPPTPVINPVLVLVALMWAGSNLVTKWLLEVLEPQALLALRMGIIAVLMTAMLLVGPRRRLKLADTALLLLAGGGLVALQVLSFSYAMKLTTASEGALLISTAPAWTAVLVAFLGMERVTSVNWLGIAVASGGVAMIVLGSGDRMAPNAPARVPGDLLMLSSAWLFAGYMVLGKRWMQRWGELRVISLTFAGAGVLLAFTGAREFLATDWRALTPGHWLGIGHVTLLGGFLGVILWYRTMSRTSASGTAVYQFLVPVLAVVGAAAFLDERIARLQFAGIAVALVGVYMARVRTRPVVQDPDGGGGA